MHTPHRLGIGKLFRLLEGDVGFHDEDRPLCLCELSVQGIQCAVDQTHIAEDLQDLGQPPLGMDVDNGLILLLCQTSCNSMTRVQQRP